MTVGELMADLRRFNPATPVLVDGYEGGFNDARGPQFMLVARQPEGMGWRMGQYEAVDAGALASRAFAAVVLSRESSDGT